MRCLAFVLVAAVLAAPAQAATLFTVELNGAQEVPPTGSTGTGVGSLTLENTGGGIVLSYAVEFDDTHDFGPVLGGAFGNIDGVQQDPGGITGSDVSRLHVHNAARGANGPVVYGIINPDGDTDNDVSITQILGGFLLAGSWSQADGLTGFLPILLAAQAGDDVPLYFNLHTGDNPAGAIRGQIVAVNSLNAIPLPAALPLMLVALSMLGLSGRRRA